MENIYCLLQALLYGYCFTEMLAPRCHHATLTEMDSFCLMGAEEQGDKRLQKKTKNNNNCELDSVLQSTHRTLNQSQSSSPGRRSFQGMEFLPFNPRHCSLPIVLMLFPLKCPWPTPVISPFPERPLVQQVVLGSSPARLFWEGSMPEHLLWQEAL